MTVDLSDLFAKNQNDIVLDVTQKFQIRNLLDTKKLENPYVPSIGYNLESFFLKGVNTMILKGFIAQYLAEYGITPNAILFSSSIKGNLSVSITTNEEVFNVVVQ